MKFTVSRPIGSFCWLIGLAVGAATLWPAVANAQESTPVDSLALARQYTQWLYDGMADSLVAHSTEDARGQFATVDRYTNTSRTIAERGGTEVKVLEETWKLRNGRCQYWRAATFDRIDQPLLVRWVLDPDGRIDGLGLGPLSDAPPVDAEHC